MIQIELPVMDSPKPTSRQNVSHEPGAFVPVPVATLHCHQPFTVDLYVLTQQELPPVLYRRAHVPADRSEVTRLIQQGIRTIYVRSHDYTAYQDFLRDHLQGLIEDSSVPPAERLSFLSERAREVLKSAFAARDVSRLLEQATPVASHLVQLVQDSELLAADVHAMLRHDWCMFAHAFHVAAYTALLARAYGLDDPPTLESIALGALLHDIGKLRLPARMLTKKLALNEFEERLARQHPQYGFERLCYRDDLTLDQLMIVYQHHEQPDGRGYPVGLGGNEIHPWARLTAVANAFDSRTTARPYRAAMSAQDALESMQRLAGAALDREMVQCWTQLMSA